MTAYYPLFEDELKEGPPGMPGIGFKLTNDGNYDMEDKILKNCKSPEDDNDASTKSYVNDNIASVKETLQKETDAQLKSEIVALKNTCLTHSDKGPFDAKGKTIGNLDDPKLDMNAVNKRYFENNALVLKSNEFDAKNRAIKNVNEPSDENDVVTKKYLQQNGILLNTRGTAFSAKDLYIESVHDPKDPQDAVTKNYFQNNALILKSGSYDAKNKNISNVKWPINSGDCANKSYVDNKTFCATTDRVVEFTGVGYKTFQFNEFSSKLLDSNLALAQDMFMKITIYLACDKMGETPSIRLEKGQEVLIDRAISVNKESLTWFGYGKVNEVMMLSVLTGGKCKLKPYLHIEKIVFSLKK